MYRPPCRPYGWPRAISLSIGEKWYMYGTATTFVPRREIWAGGKGDVAADLGSMAGLCGGSYMCMTCVCALVESDEDGRQ